MYVLSNVSYTMPFFDERYPEAQSDGGAAFGLVVLSPSQVRTFNVASFKGVYFLTDMLATSLWDKRMRGLIEEFDHGGRRLPRCLRR
jgi:hypothetical protein